MKDAEIKSAIEVCRAAVKCLTPDLGDLALKWLARSDQDIEDRRHPYGPELRDLFRRMEDNGLVPGHVFDTEEDVVCETWDDVYKAIMATDEGTVYFSEPGVGGHWAFLILGNGPGDLICNYGCCDIMDRISSEHFNKWER
jgi:hypothetical protein